MQDPNDIPPWHSAAPTTQETKQNPTSTCQGYIHKESQKATLFEVIQVNGRPVKEPKSVWFPISRTKSLTRAAPGSDDYDNITVEDWLIEKNGIK
jgi:hypothetical protein